MPEDFEIEGLDLELNDNNLNYSSKKEEVIFGDIDLTDKKYDGKNVNIDIGNKESIDNSYNKENIDNVSIGKNSTASFNIGKISIGDNKKKENEINSSNVFGVVDTRKIISYYENIKSKIDNVEKEKIKTDETLNKVLSYEKELSKEYKTPDVEKKIEEVNKFKNEILEKNKKELLEYSVLKKKSEEIFKELIERSYKNDKESSILSDVRGAFSEFKSDIDKKRVEFEDNLIKFRKTDVNSLNKDEKEVFLKEKSEFKSFAKDMIENEIENLKKVNETETNNTSLFDQRKKNISELKSILQNFDRNVENYNPLLGLGNNPILGLSQKILMKKKEELDEEEKFFLNKNKILEEIKNEIPEFQKNQLISELKEIISEDNSTGKSLEIIDEYLGKISNIKKEIDEKDKEINNYSEEDKLSILKRKESIDKNLSFIKDLKENIKNGEGRTAIINKIKSFDNSNKKEILLDEEKERMFFSNFYKIVEENKKDVLIGEKLNSFFDTNSDYVQNILSRKYDIKKLRYKVSRLSLNPDPNTANEILENSYGFLKNIYLPHSLNADDLRNQIFGKEEKVIDLKNYDNTSDTIKDSILSLKGSIKDKEDYKNKIFEAKKELLKENDPEKRAGINERIKIIKEKQGYLDEDIKSNLLKKKEAEDSFIKENIGVIDEKIKRYQSLPNLSKVDSIILEGLLNSKELLLNASSKTEDFLGKINLGDYSFSDTDISSFEDNLFAFENLKGISDKTFRNVISENVEKYGIKEEVFSQIDLLKGKVKNREEGLDKIDSLKEKIKDRNENSSNGIIALNELYLKETDELKKVEIKKKIEDLELLNNQDLKEIDNIERNIPTISEIKNIIDIVEKDFFPNSGSLKGLNDIIKSISSGEKVEDDVFDKDILREYLKRKENEALGNYLNKDTIGEGDIDNYLSVSEVKEKEKELKELSKSEIVKDLNEINNFGTLSEKNRGEMDVLIKDSYFYDALGNRIKKGDEFLFGKRGLGIRERFEDKEMLIDLNGRKVNALMSFVKTEDGREGYVLKEILRSKVPTLMSSIEEKIEKSTMGTLGFYRNNNKKEFFKTFSMNYKNNGGMLGLGASIIAIFFNLEELFSFIVKKIQDFIDGIFAFVKRNLIQIFFWIFGVTMVGVILITFVDGTDKLLFAKTINPLLFSPIRIENLGDVISRIESSYGGTEMIKTFFYFLFNFINAGFAIFLGGITYALLILIIMEVLKFTGQISDIEETESSEIMKSSDKKIVAKVKLIFYVILLLIIIILNKFILI